MAPEDSLTPLENIEENALEPIKNLTWWYFF
jgi:hypothetical protein